MASSNKKTTELDNVNAIVYQAKIYTHVIDGMTIRTNLSEQDFKNEKLWQLRSVRAWALAIYAEHVHSERI